ncbi:MAG: IS66 family transposase [Candidatus Rokubacteria bacterium]|jgi:hypothetical protein|nr:IS66 family transposase [Candidatus Rokubacteria bacterium]
MKSKKPRIVDIEMAAVDGLVGRAKELLSMQDYELLKGLVETLLTLLRLVREGRTTIARLRRLFGLAQSEKTADVLERVGEGDKAANTGADDQDAADPAAEKPSGDEKKTGARAVEKPKQKGHGRDAASAYPDACVFHVLHDKLRIGQRCPLCGRGNLYALEPKTILRILGQAPLAGICWKCERLRCSGCGAIFEADLPPEAQGPKHDATAAAMIAYLRFRAGVPHNRLQQIQRNLRTPLPASTQWDVIREWSDGPLYIYLELCRLGAQASIFHTDDTSMPILALMGKRRAKLVSRGELPDPERTGLFTTGIVSIMEGRTLALFFTGRQHAGENLADLLRQRASDLEAAILMCDGLDRNIPKGHKVIEGNCGSHARRGLVDQAVNWPHECRDLLETYGTVFKIDELCRKEGLSDEQRLRRHQAESGPLMDELKKQLEDLLKDKRVEPNSGLGDAINYILKRWEKLTLFLRVPGAPLHNNLCERTLKMAIRHRNNSLFYKSELGALMGDVYMSVIYTAELAGENGIQYLTELMRHEKAAAADPVAWLPWNYRATLARLDAAQSAREEPSRPPASRPPTSRPMMGPRPPAPSPPPPAPP